jgi:hypothetical protein
MVLGSNRGLETVVGHQGLPQYRSGQIIKQTVKQTFIIQLPGSNLGLP